MNRLSLILMLLAVMALVIMTGCDREITNSSNEEPTSDLSSNCFACHDYGKDLGTEVKLAMRQYENSVHGSGAHIETGSCDVCHTTEGFIEKVTGETIDSDAYNAVGCFACHNPHENGNFALRITSPVTLENGVVYDREESNLCVQCHHSRRDASEYVYDGVKLSSHWGPHHNNQSDMLLGTNAYEYDGYDYSVKSWHATGVSEGCVKCHFRTSEGYTLGGHTFNMSWGEEPDETDNIDACNVTGCHATYTEIEDFDRVTDNDFDQDGDATEGVQTEIGDLMAQLEELLVDAGLVTYNAEEDSYSPVANLVVPNADSAGALYNYEFVKEDKSEGIHDTRYAAAILISSINYLEYGDPEGPAAVSKPQASLAMPSH